VLSGWIVVTFNGCGNLHCSDEKVSEGMALAIQIGIIQGKNKLGALAQTEKNSVLKSCEDYFAQHGTDRCTVKDSDEEFKADELKKLCDEVKALN